MEHILDFEYVLRPVEVEQSEVAQTDYEAARRDFGSERDALFQREEDIINYRLYGPPFEGAPPPEPPEWGKFVGDCQNHLAKKSKDLWICVWLTEVLMAQHGFKGLAEGFELIRRVCEDHWDQLQPDPASEIGVGYTVKLLSAVSKRDAFIDALRLAPITMASGQFLPASCATIDTIDGGERLALLGETADEFISELYASAKKANEEWQLLDDVLDKCGDDKPPFAKVREALKTCIDDIVATYPQVIIEDEPEETGLTVAGQMGGNGQFGSLTGDSHIKNREQAFKTLEALSRYFRENEPNSPVSLALKQAIRWGRMSFQELLKDVVDDEDARQQILRLTGSRENDENQGYGGSDDE